MHYLVIVALVGDCNKLYKEADCEKKPTTLVKNLGKKYWIIQIPQQHIINILSDLPQKARFLVIATILIFFSKSCGHEMQSL